MKRACSAQAVRPFFMTFFETINMKLLLAEDDLQIGEGLKMGLSAADFQVNWVANGHDVMDAIEQADYDLLVLDLGLPNLDGMSILRRLRPRAHRPATLVLSARSMSSDRVECLNLGADDYVVKPFDFDELVARLHALHRRALGRKTPEIKHGNLTIHPLQRSVVVDDKVVALTSREFDVLMALAERPNTVRSLSWLENRVSHDASELASNAMQVHIHHLRKKLGGSWIQNVRGMGYQFTTT
jgi:DNA-binding response OmpR family regulator